MTITVALAFIYICSEADTRTGIWKGSAKALSGELGIPERTARDVLEKMEHGDYVRRFAVPGRHSCYPVLVHKYLITDGEHRGEQLDALNSIEANTLRYLRVETREQDVECGVQRGVEHGAAQKRKRKEKETNTKAEAAAFSAIGFDRPFGQKAFQAVWVRRFSEPKADEWLTVVMEAAIQECQRKNIGVPPQFYEAKRHVEAQEYAEAQRRFRKTPL
jgi:hypothetical protein